MTKSGFNEIRSVITKGNESGLMTAIGKKITLSDTKKDDKTDEADGEQPDTTDMPNLESEESAKPRRSQQGQGLKTRTPNQMLSGLPITLAQLKAGNNPEKLKNEIRQILYVLYRSKKLSKTIYNNLINTI